MVVDAAEALRRHAATLRATLNEARAEAASMLLVPKSVVTFPLLPNDRSRLPAEL